MTILDTNVVSELMRPDPSPAVLSWVSPPPSDVLYATTITLAEILYGIERLPQGRRRNVMLAGAERMFSKVLTGRVLAFEEEAAHAFAPFA